MAITGLIGTGDFVANERPLNWRQGILMRFPNGMTPLVGLTSALKKKTTDDPQFNWWERELSNQRLELDAATGDLDATGGTDTINVVADPFGFGGADQLKAGHILRVEESEELLLVTADPAGSTSFSAQRGYAGTTVTAVDADGVGVNPHLMIVGSVHEEGALTPRNVRYRPGQFFNYTQIWRNSLKATRTGMKTRLRTVQEVQDAKTQALLYHGIEMEWGFWFGQAVEEVGPDGEMRRATGGIISYIPAGNVVDQAGADMDLETLEDHLLNAFRFGSNEKMGFLGNRAMLAVQRIVRRNASLEITPMVKEFGMFVRRLFTPYGTVVLKTHPLWNLIQGGTTGGGDYYGLDSWFAILDMANVTYRPFVDADTKYLPNRQDNGLDGMASEYLTEAGLEVNHSKTHFLIKGLVNGISDT